MNIDHSPRRQSVPAPRTAARQKGAFAIEFAIVFSLFISMMFMILEVSRALYMSNTLQEVTRRAARAAATTDFSDVGAMNAVRRDAIFNSATGRLLLGAPVTENHVVIDYLSLQNQGATMAQVPIPAGSLAACPARNRLICTANSSDPQCIRLVRVRICQPGTACTPVPYSTLLSVVKLPFDVPMATTVVRAESLGYSPGMPMCN